MAVNHIPAGYTSVTPYIMVDNCAAAIEFYKKAFAAEEVERMEGPGGKIMHAEIRVHGGMIMLADDPDGKSSPKALGGVTGALMIYVRDVDAAFQQAVEAGVTVEQPPTDMFWGDRYCKLRDPFGHLWSLATHVRDVSKEEMEAAAQAFAAGNK